jgi:hypothetical protein
MNQIVKIGRTYINLSCVIHVDAENPKSLRVTFVDGQSKNFDGEIAKQLMKTLEANSKTY